MTEGPAPEPGPMKAMPSRHRLKYTVVTMTTVPPLPTSMLRLVVFIPTLATSHLQTLWYVLTSKRTESL